MTYGPPEQNASTAPTPSQQPWTGQPQQPWTDPHGRTWPGGPPPAAAPKGSWPAVFAVIFGLAGCVVFLLPVNMNTWRAYSPLPFALPGVALAVFGCIGSRRGKPLAAVGWVLSSIALILSLFMIVQKFTH